MELISGFSYERAGNAEALEAKLLIFKVLEEFGLQPDDPSLDGDMDDLEYHYHDGFFGILKNPEKEIIGTFALYKLGPKTFEIRKMYLLPEYRSLGLGKWMLNFLIDKARTLGYEKLELKTASVLQAAIALYRKTGFDEVTSSDASPRCDRAFELYL